MNIGDTIWHFVLSRSTGNKFPRYFESKFDGYYM